MTKWILRDTYTDKNINLDADNLNDSINVVGNMLKKGSGEISVELSGAGLNSEDGYRRTYYNIIGYDNLFIVKEVVLSK